MKTTLGSQIIAELGRRGLRGQFFDFHGYCDLRRVDDEQALRQFLDEHRWQKAPATTAPDAVVDALAESTTPSASTWGLLLSEPLFTLLTALLR
ncbi:MAG: hypothetical protein CMJ58_16310 [Planctomycetaceae bacterium]|nr:hypothetical protein [Planctomycetaceae bacterium]